MGRVSVEESWFSDPRRDYLREKVGDAVDTTAIALWRTGQKYWSDEMKLVPLSVFKLLKHYQHLLDAQLAEVRGDEVYVRGSSEWLSWATVQRAGRVAGGKARAGAPRGPNGAFLPAEAQLEPSSTPADPQLDTTILQRSGSGSGSDRNSSSSKTNTPKSPIAAREIEFHVYRHYPRKVGKSDGLRAAQRVLKSPDEMLAMERAAVNFRAAMQREGRPTDKIPYFSTWVNSQWRDWVEPETSEDFAKSAAAPAGSGVRVDPVKAEAAMVGAAVRAYGDSASDQAALKAELGEDLYAVVCRSNMARLRGLKNDDWYLKNVAQALSDTRARMAARASPAESDPITNREASRLLATLGVK